MDPSTGAGQTDAEPLTGDPEIAALLAFEPVPRRLERENGWAAQNQRAFIALLVETGNYRRAAQALGLTASGVYQLRKDAGAEDFSRAWDEAIALHKARNRAPPPRPARAPRDARARRAAAAEIDGDERYALLQEILRRYMIKLGAERRSRLEGRIVEADFYVRQLTFVEIALDIGGRAQELLDQWKSGDVHLVQVVATPMSVLLEKLRRAYWLEKGEADRPPPPPLGEHDAAASTGIPTSYIAARDGDHEAWRRRRDQARATAAEAQAAWEEKARADAEAWRARVEEGEGEGRR